MYLDHKPLSVYYNNHKKKTTTDESFLFQKKFVMWERYKCLELKKEICDHNKFNILIEKLGNGELNLITVVLLVQRIQFIPHYINNFFFLRNFN